MPKLTKCNFWAQNVEIYGKTTIHSCCVHISFSGFGIMEWDNSFSGLTKMQISDIFKCFTWKIQVWSGIIFSKSKNQLLGGSGHQIRNWDCQLINKKSFQFYKMKLQIEFSKIKNDLRESLDYVQSFFVQECFQITQGIEYLCKRQIWLKKIRSKNKRKPITFFLGKLTTYGLSKP